MNAHTENFLAICLKYGLKRVCIFTAHEIVPESRTFSFGPQDSVFGLKRTNSRTSDHDGWPAIWRVVEEAKYSGGCGNSNQHQVNSKARIELEAGAYKRVNGKWRKL